MMTAEPGLDLEHLREWIGREDLAEDVVTADLARKYHAMFDGAGSPPGPGDIVPRLIHFCLAQPAAPTAELGADGHAARGGFLPPVPLPRRMWAGGRLVFERPLRVGERVERESTILSVDGKQGRSGTLVFVTVRHAYRAGGATALTEEHDIVYRDAKKPGDVDPPPAARPVSLLQAAISQNARRAEAGQGVGLTGDLQGGGV